MSLLAELRLRNVIRMAGLYLVGTSLVAQVAATLLTVFEARRSPEFPAFLRAMGVAAGWDESGASDQCRKDAPGDDHRE